MEDLLATRFWAKVERDFTDLAGCWIWTGARNEHGYGVFNGRGKPRMARAHRFAYEALFGPIPDDLDLDHMCHNRAVERGECVGGDGCPHRACVNPAHMLPSSRSANVGRGYGPIASVLRMEAKTHCKHGHPFTEENTRISPQGWRLCRVCAREKVKRYASTPRTRQHRSTACPQGHPYDEASTGVMWNGERYCRICKREQTAAYRARKRAAQT